MTLPLLNAWRRWGQNGLGPAALSDDLVAALIVTVLLVPQSLAYAMLAGLPPVVGVMASVLPLLAYAALGSSATLAVGPVAVLAMMTAQAVGPVASAHGVPATTVAMVLAMEMGLVLAVAWALRLDVLAALLSAPVLHGFITGACLVIALAQVPALLGVPVRGNTAWELWASAQKAPSLAPHAATAAIGVAALVSLWALRRWAAAWGRAVGLSSKASMLVARLAPMLVVGLAMVWVAWQPVLTQGVALTGAVDVWQGLRFEGWWHAPWRVWMGLWPAAALLGLVAYVESLAVAEALAAKRGEKIAPRRELLGLSAANVVASVSGGMPVTGGFARSIVNFDAGARTRWAGVWTAIFLALAVLLLGEVLSLLPKAVLAATIIVAVLSLVDWKPFAAAQRFAPLEAGLMATVALLTIVVGVEAALGVGVLVAAGLLLQRTARPHWAEVGRLPGTEVFRNVKRFDVQTLPHVAVIRVDESLLFTNTRWLSDTLGGLPGERPALQHVVLMMTGVNDIDFTGLEGLRQLAQDLHQRGVALHLSELKGPVQDKLQATGLGTWLTGQVFRSQHEAQAALEALGALGAQGPKP